MTAEQHQIAAYIWTTPTDLSHMAACRWPGNYIHHRHLLLLSQKTDTQFTIPWKVKGCIVLDSWLHIKVVYLLLSSNCAQCQSTMLIKTNMLSTTHMHVYYSYYTDKCSLVLDIFRWYVNSRIFHIQAFILYISSIILSSPLAKNSLQPCLVAQNMRSSN